MSASLSNCVNTNQVLPHVINGPLAPENANAFAWSTNGYLAFGCYNRIMIVDTSDRLRLCQNLNKHRHSVCRIHWCPDGSMRLLSVDTKGNLIVWNVQSGQFLTLIMAQGKEERPLLDAKWINFSRTVDDKDFSNSGLNQCQTQSMINQSINNYQILILYGNNVFVLYDSDLGEPIWKRSFLSSPESDYHFQSFEIDPFNERQLLVSIVNQNPQNCECCFVTINDISQAKNSLKVFQIYLANCEETALGSPKLHLSTSNTTNTNTTTTSSSSSSTSSSFLQTSLQRYMKMIGKSLSKKHNHPVSVSHLLEYKQLSFHQSNGNQAIVVFDREIHLADLSFGQILCVIRAEGNFSNFVYVYSCWQRQLLFCLHQNGAVSVRLAQRKRRREEHIGTDVVELSYSTVCLSDALRLTKYNKIFGFQINRTLETQISLLSNNGKIYVYNLFSPIGPRHQILFRCNVIGLSDLIPIVDNQYSQNDFKTTAKLSLIMHKNFSCLNAGTHVIRMCPPLRPRNWFFHRPFLAIGDSNGVIQIYNVATNLLEKEYAVHSAAVKGIEWINMNQFLSFAYGNSSNKPINELRLTDLVSGRSKSIREDKNGESGPIERIKISCRRKYFVIGFKSDPFEIWDLEKLCCIRQMSSFPCTLTSIEWSPQPMRESQNKVKECFMITNTENELYRFSVEGSTIRQMSTTPHLSAQITATAWKSERIMFGDAVGNLMQWDIANKRTRLESTGRGMVRKMLFAPGKESYYVMLLFVDGVSIWNSVEMRLHSQLKYPRDMHFRIEDVDWAATDRPVLLTSEGSILISDLCLKHFHSDLNTLKFYTDEDAVMDAMLCEMDLLAYAGLDETKKAEIAIRVLHNQAPLKLKLNLLHRCLLWLRAIGNLDYVQFLELIRHHADESHWLDSGYECYMRNLPYKRLQSDKVALYELKRIRHEHNELCSELHLYLGNDQRSVQLLLETESSQKQLYLKDSLKACLVSLLVQNERSQNVISHPVIKLVATNLIANENVDEGVQLLFIIGKLLDACRYLQSSNTWDKSLLLSKTNLEQSEFEEINARWPEYLASNRRPKDRLFALVSLNSHSKVIDHLLDHQQLQMAVVYCDLWMGKQRFTDSMILDRVAHVYEQYAEHLEQHKFVDLGKEYRQKSSLALKAKNNEQNQEIEKEHEEDDNKKKEEEIEEGEEEGQRTKENEESRQKTKDDENHFWPDEIHLKVENPYGPTKYFHPVLTDAI